MAQTASDRRSVNSISFFDRWSASYDSGILQRFTYRPLHDAVLGHLGPISPRRVLDMGCGTGQLTRRLATHFDHAQVTGFDYSAGMLNQAQDRLIPLENAALGRADATNLPVAPGSLDLIVCTESFHWYPDQEKALRDMCAALSRGGRVAIGSVAAFNGVDQRAVELMSTRIDRPVRALTPSAMADMMDAVGIRVIFQRRIPRPSVLLPLPLLTIGHKP
ncbi:MAG: class I SAM-dependent methyltransferase [Acidimicrobiales bacterium]